MEFHVHTNASNLAIGTMLAQNLIGKCDQLIAYASKLLNNVKKNYTTTKRRTIAMVYALHKSRHYMLGNKFIFYVKHMALLYLIKKPQLLGQIAKWLLLFLEYDFSMVYIPRHYHSVVDALSRLLDAIENPRVLNKTIDASLFVFQLEWLQEVHTYIYIEIFPKGYSME